MDESRRRTVGSLIFALGLIALLIGALTRVYSTTTGVIIMFAIWFVGGAIAALLLQDKEEPPKT